MDIPINLKKKVDNSYSVVFTGNVKAGLMNDFRNYGKYVIITDSGVKRFCSKTARGMQTCLNALLIAIPEGEKSKNRAMKEKIEDYMLKNGCGRDTLIIAFGGGVVGDLAGFVAATFCRGIDYVQVPTTLLAMVDSSIGGKVAIDTPYGKNLIGAFHQPKRVYIDINFLKGLPKKQLINGISEIIKCGIIADEKLFGFLEKNRKSIMNLDEGALMHIISSSCRIKKEITEKDEKEANLRKILNFGHTIGHAVELSSDYEMAHGEAISVGMFYESKIATKCGLLTEAEAKRVESLLGSFGLPAKIKLDAKKIIKFTKSDKKAREGNAEYVLPGRIGKMEQVNGKYSFRIPDKIVEEALTDGRFEKNKKKD